MIPVITYTFCSYRLVKYYIITDCELISENFKIVSKSSQFNDIGKVLCKSGNMFYEDSLVTNRTAICDKNAKWSFNSTNLHCYEGLIAVILLVKTNVYKCI